MFLDFEASSLGKQSYPIEVAWVFEDGRSEAHLIRPAADWTDWSEEAAAIHHISRETLAAEGRSPEEVAERMIAVLDGHELFASAPSWDGKWLSALLRAGGRPRHALRLRDSDDLDAETARAILAPVLAGEALEQEVANLLTLCEVRAPGVPPAHRALADAEEERQRWLAVKGAAEAMAAGLGG